MMHSRSTISGLIFVNLFIIATVMALAVPAPPASPGDPDSAFVLTVLSPTANARLVSSSVLLSYKHSTGETLFCLAALDSDSWSEDDPRWTDPDLVKDAQVSSGQVHKESFFEVADGSHTFEIMCENDPGTILLHTYVEFQVSASNDETGSLRISPSSAQPGRPVMISSNTFFGSTAVIVVLSPDGEEEQFDVPSRNGFSYSYALPLTALTGEYLVDVYDENGDVMSGSFTVAAAQPALNLIDPRLLVNVPITIGGKGFPPLASIFLGAKGPGSDRSDTVFSDANGSFVFTYSSFSQPGLHSVTAIGGGSVSVLEFFVKEESSTVPAPLPDPGVEDDFDLPPGPSDFEIPTPPLPEQPNIVQEQPTVIASESSSLSLFWIVGSILLGLLLVGSAGALAWRGTLPVPFLKEATGTVLGWLHHSLASAPQNPELIAQVQSFVLDERTKGYDDLTIRSALIAKGWDRSLVDAAFDTLYRKK